MERRTISKWILFLAFAMLSCKFGMANAADLHQGKQVLPGVMLLTGYDLRPFQTAFQIPELADPYVTRMPEGVVISGTAQYYLKFKSIDDIRLGGPYTVVWNDFYYSDGTPMEGQRFAAHSWDMKPVLWSRDKSQLRLWSESRDKLPPLVVWYGGHMRPQGGAKISRWPEDNFSRDIFAFTERDPGKWFSESESIFRGGARSRYMWPRPEGNFLGHRYGHQIIMQSRPVVFYEEVTAVRSNGQPAITKIFVDEMATPFAVRGAPKELISPINPRTGKAYPSAMREDGSALVEGPLYFRFSFEGEEWEAIAFSAGSYYGSYPACFASRKVADGLTGEPYLVDLKDDGSDLHDAGARLGRLLKLTGGPGRPSVLVNSDGEAVRAPNGMLQLLVHGYRQDVRSFRLMMHAYLAVKRGSNGSLRFDIAVQ